MKLPAHILICLDCQWHAIMDFENISDSVALHMTQYPTHKSFVAAEEPPEEPEFDS